MYICSSLFSIQQDMTRRNIKKFENIRENSKRENSCDHVSHRKHHFHPTMSVICIFSFHFNFFFFFFLRVFHFFVIPLFVKQKKLNNPRFSPPLTLSSVFLFSNRLADLVIKFYRVRRVVVMGMDN